MIEISAEKVAILRYVKGRLRCKSTGANVHDIGNILFNIEFLIDSPIELQDVVFNNIYTGIMRKAEKYL